MGRIEQPIALGNRCHWLPKRQHLHPYRNTEDEILDAFRRVPRHERQPVCQEYARCRAFMEAWRNGQIPALERDPIEVHHHDGDYWVPEGKHRVCAAIQSGVSQITVPVIDVPHRRQPLPPLGQPGRFAAQWWADRGERPRRGAWFYLFADFTRPFGRVITIQAYVGHKASVTWPEDTDLVPGIRFRVMALSPRHQWWRRGARHYRVEVDVASSLPPGKVWLAEVPLVNGYPNPQHRIDHFRRGIIRPGTCPVLEGP